jgi:hypothetical protein
LSSDVERQAAPGCILPSDPYQFRESILDDDALAQLRSMKKGKRLAKYHRKQNDVSLAFHTRHAYSSLLSSSSPLFLNQWKSTLKKLSLKKKPHVSPYVMFSLFPVHLLTFSPGKDCRLLQLDRQLFTLYPSEYVQ